MHDRRTKIALVVAVLASSDACTPMCAALAHSARSPRGEPPVLLECGCTMLVQQQKAEHRHTAVLDTLTNWVPATMAKGKKMR